MTPDIPTDEVPLDLDMLMTLDPLKLGKQDVDTIIQYHRNVRVAREQGKGRAAAAKTSAAKPKGIAELLASKKPVVSVTRRGF